MATVRELIGERRKHLSECWQEFLNHPLHSSIGLIVEREKTNLPSNYVPWAPAIAIASNPLLKTARQARSLNVWRKHLRHGYYYFCKVRIRERSGFWFVERGYHQVLVFRFGSMPICARTHRDAIALFEYVFHQSGDSYDPPVGPRAHSLRWVNKTPDGISGC